MSSFFNPKEKEFVEFDLREGTLSFVVKFANFATSPIFIKK